MSSELPVAALDHALDQLFHDTTTAGADAAPPSSHPPAAVGGGDPSSQKQRPPPPSSRDRDAPRDNRGGPRERDDRDRGRFERDDRRGGGGDRDRDMRDRRGPDRRDRSRSRSRDRGPGKLFFRFVVRSTEFGLVVGPKGNNIRKVRDAGYNLKADIVDPPDTVLRSLRLSKDHVLYRCVNLVAPNDAQGFEGLIRGARALFDIVAAGDREPDAGNIFRILVTHAQASSVIGKKGSRVQSLRAKTGAVVGCFKSVEKECQGMPVSSEEEIVSIEGHPEQIRLAIPDTLEHIRYALPPSSPFSC